MTLLQGVAGAIRDDEAPAQAVQVEETIVSAIGNLIAPLEGALAYSEPELEAPAALLTNSSSAALTTSAPIEQLNGVSPMSTIAILAGVVVVLLSTCFAAWRLAARAPPPDQKVAAQAARKTTARKPKAASTQDKGSRDTTARDNPPVLQLRSKTPKAAEPVVKEAPPSQVAAPPAGSSSIHVAPRAQIDDLRMGNISTQEEVDALREASAVMRALRAGAADLLANDGPTPPASPPGSSAPSRDSSTRRKTRLSGMTAPSSSQTKPLLLLSFALLVGVALLLVGILDAVAPAPPPPPPPLPPPETDLLRPSPPPSLPLPPLAPGEVHVSSASALAASHHLTELLARLGDTAVARLLPGQVPSVSSGRGVSLAQTREYADRLRNCSAAYFGPECCYELDPLSAASGGAAARSRLCVALRVDAVTGNTLLDMRLAALDPSPFRGVLEGTISDPFNRSLSTASGDLVTNLTGSVEAPFAAGSAVRTPPHPGFPPRACLIVSTDALTTHLMFVPHAVDSSPLAARARALNAGAHRLALEWQRPHPGRCDGPASGLAAAVAGHEGLRQPATRPLASVYVHR